MTLPNFDALRELHESANDMLHSPVMKREIAQQGREKWTHQVSEISLRMIYVCGTTKNMVLLLKNHVHELKSTFRRISVNAITENKFATFHCQRKKLKLEMLKRLHILKGMKNNTKCIIASSSSIDNLMVVVNVLRQVRAAAMSILESLMGLMSMPNPNTSKGYFRSKLLRVNSLSSWEKCDAMTLQCANKRLETVEIAIEDLEGELQCINRRLIRTRVSLLNLLTY